MQTCKQWKQYTKFNRDNSNLHNNRGGLCTQCKECQRKRYYEERNRILNNDYLALKYKLNAALKSAKRRCKEYNRFIDIDLDYLFYLWNKQNGKCALTGMDMTYKFYEGRVNSNLSIDRIDSSKGYTKDNVQLVCMVANQMKNDLSLEEFINICANVINYNKTKNRRIKLWDVEARNLEARKAERRQVKEASNDVGRCS